jgi:hypothetical protein
MKQTGQLKASKPSAKSLLQALELHERGFCVVPLIQGTKRPCIKWKEFQTVMTTQQQVIDWFIQWPEADIGVITGAVSNMMVLDYDQEPYPDNDHAYITTTRGRHYYYKYYPGDLHGLQVKPGIDIPRLAKFYELPTINESRIPLQPTYTPQAAPSSGWDDDNPPDFTDILGCEFIQWFMAERTNPRWDGRYPLARAYAANVLKTNNPDTNLGTGYQHTDAILASTTRPITCEAIGQHWKCPRMNDYGMCMKAAGVRTPYGLAKRNQK